jgi:tetratricopeptide (TPR) repeat protein
LILFVKQQVNSPSIQFLVCESKKNIAQKVLILLKTILVLRTIFLEKFQVKLVLVIMALFFVLTNSSAQSLGRGAVTFSGEIEGVYFNISGDLEFTKYVLRNTQPEVQVKWNWLKVNHIEYGGVSYNELNNPINANFDYLKEDFYGEVEILDYIPTKSNPQRVEETVYAGQIANFLYQMDKEVWEGYGMEIRAEHRDEWENHNDHGVVTLKSVGGKVIDDMIRKVIKRKTELDNQKQGDADQASDQDNDGTKDKAEKEEDKENEKGADNDNNSNKNNNLSEDQNSRVNSSNYYLNLGRDAEMRGDLPTAIAYYQKAYEILPNPQTVQKISQLRKDALINGVTNIAVEIMHARDKMIKEEIEASKLQYEESKTDYKRKLEYYKVHWKGLKEFLSFRSISLDSNWTESNQFYAYLFMRDVEGAVSWIDISLDNNLADYSKLKYKIIHTEPVRIEKSKLSIVPGEEREQVVIKAIKKFTNYSDQSLYIAFSGSIKEGNEMLKLAKELDSTVTFESANSGITNLENHFDLNKYFDGNLLENMTIKDMVERGTFNSGDHVFYLNSGGVMFVKEGRFIVFQNRKFFNAYHYENLNTQIAAYRKWVKEQNQVNSLVPLAIIEEQEYISNLGEISRGKNLKSGVTWGEMIDNERFDIPLIYHPNSNDFDHFYVLEYASEKYNVPDPDLIPFDYHRFLEYTANSSDKCNRPIVAFGTMSSEISKYGHLMIDYSIEGIIEYYPAMKIEKAQKEDSDKGILQFTSTETKGFNPYLNEYYDNTHYFGLKAKPKPLQGTDRYIWHTSKTKFKRYDISSSKIGIVYESRRYGENVDYNKLYEHVKKLKLENKLTDWQEEFIKKYLTTDYMNHLSHEDTGYRQITAVYKKPFFIKLNGEKIDLTKDEIAKDDQTGKTYDSDFSLLYSKLKSLLPKDQYTWTTNFQTSSHIELLSD